MVEKKNIYIKQFLYIKLRKDWSEFNLLQSTIPISSSGIK